ncbi:MAG: outer membrane protein assembly factor BamD [Bacteroidales bacterium]|nr:outer membrane protein assembly factor BamD [Bacteroidales bacterium]
MFRKTVIGLIISIIAIASFSCSKYQKIQKSQDFGLKYEKALEYYEKEDYFRALTLFDQVMPFYRGTEDAENIAYKYAYAYYNQREYTMASYYFDRFSKTYPRSEKAEECAYMSAYCKYLESPKYELDQTTSRDAIAELQLFINNYPYSDRVEKCNELIDELREKIQKKDFEIAKLYLKMEKYQAAVTSFDILLKDYPDTKFREDAMFYTIKSYFNYANQSVRSKRKERYLEATDVYTKFIAQYPDSKYNKQVNYMYEKAMKEINN